MSSNLKSNKPSGVPLYQLKITLKGSRPPIWRRVVVRGDMALDRLHNLIQIAMGWSDSHLHQFIAGSGFARAFYGVPDREFAEMGSEMLNEKRYTVAGLAPVAKRKFTYEYDFGDGWLHEVVAEKILAPDPAFKHPVCLAGANACPPEDCGGMGGYYNLLETMADPKNPEYADMKQWLCGDWDAGRFDLEEINAGLKRFKAWVSGPVARTGRRKDRAVLQHADNRNVFMTNRGWRDAGTQRLNERPAEIGLPPGTVQTMFEFIDLDEGRPKPGAQ